jgi:anti-sigma regulatory factor (Ser/Thr protein kinase)
VFVGDSVLAPPATAHVVSFYEHDAELITTLLRFVDEGLTLGERTVVIATAPHRAALSGELAGISVDADECQASGRLIMLDAAATLAWLLVDGAIDRGRLADLAGRLIEDARRDGVALRAFGEMVALLWEVGDVTGALELEEYWCDLVEEHDFELLCAYPTSALGDARLGDVSEICALHTSVLPPASYEAGTPSADATIAEYSQVFLPVPEAVAAVRRFVTEALQRWGEHDLIIDATLVVSELATNAVLHASSPFRVSVDRSVGVVCLAIQDIAPDHAQHRGFEGQDLSGRGMVIVEALSRRWGCDSLPTGKVVWAELATSSTTV